MIAKVLIVLSALFSLNFGIADEDSKSFAELYDIAKKSYSSNDWRNCINYTKASLKSYKKYNSIIKSCTRSCDFHEGSEFALIRHADEKDDLLVDYDRTMNFFEKLIDYTLCTMKCKKSLFLSRGSDRIDPEISSQFEDKVPYNYLQSCYSHIKDYKSAANAAYTNLIYNPDSEVMKSNLEFYTKSLDNETISTPPVNLEAPKYVSSFNHGASAYKAEDFDSVIKYFEMASIEYVDAWEGCRLNCEKPFDMGWFPDFFTSIANHFTFCLRCKQRCLEQLANIDGENNHDIFALMYHYLQYAYYQKKQIEKSSECLESYLAIFDSEELNSNKNYMLTLPEFKTEENKKWFKVRPEVRRYMSVIIREKELLDYIDERFNFLTKDDSEIKSILKPVAPVSADSDKVEL